MNIFLSILFLSREVAHREHLATTSYAQHMALDGFYNDIVGLIDSLAEAYQGRHGLIKDIPIAREENSSGSSAQKLKRYLDYVEKERYKAVPKEDTSLQNIIDEIVGLFLSTLYKLENLS